MTGMGLALGTERDGMVQGKDASGARAPIANAVDAVIRYWPFWALLVFAILWRSPVYGNPDVFLDEQFYLLVGDRMLHGALPYVDIWDRKPIGLFLIYAFSRLLGGEGFMQYQLLASVFAGVTAGMIWLVARRACGNFGATASGLLYLLWLNVYSGGAGQSPVFYNLLTMGAVWLCLCANDAGRAGDAGKIARLGGWAMLLCGCILQIKYTAVMEGMFFGAWFLWRLWRAGMAPMRIMAIAIGYGVIALLPTLIATGWYAATGHLHAFIYANFLSIFDRGRLSDSFLRMAGGFFLATTPPLAIVGSFGLMRHWQITGRQIAGKDRRDDFAFLVGWLASAILGFVMIGNFYDHYFLPVLLPAFIVIAPMLVATPIGVTAAAVLAFWALFWSGTPDAAYQRAKRAGLMRLTEATRPYVRDGQCLFIFDGPAILYMTSNACIPTRYAYPDHLSNDVEKRAIGVDAVAEMRRVLASRPGAIVTANSPVIPRLNAQTVPLLKAALGRDYLCVAAVRATKQGRAFYVHARRDLVSAQAMRHRPASCPDDYADMMR